MPALSARSVVASTLLGTIPPRLPGRLLVDFAEQFDIKPGATRVALSRMVDRGELRRADDGVHELSGALLERQDRQQAGLAPQVRSWTGVWEIHVVAGGGRESSDRAALRRAAGHLGLGERREGVWMRPDNLAPGRLPGDRAVLAAQADRFVGRPDGVDPVTLTTELFDLTGWAATATRLCTEMEAMTATLRTGADESLAPGFGLAAAALRHLVADPLLPETLWPRSRPSRRLREHYDEYNRVYRARLSAFFRSRSRLAL